MAKGSALLISVRTYGGEGLSLMKQIVRELLDSISDLEVSSVFRTKGTNLKPRHIHDLKGTNEFEGLAVCLRGHTKLSAHEVLGQLQRIEAQHKNEALRRSAVLNLLVFGSQTLMTPELTIPHPEFHREPEQLIPAAEIWADCSHPILHLTLQALVPRLSSENTMEFYAQGKSLLDF